MTTKSHVLAETPEIDLAVVAAEVDELEEYIIHQNTKAKKNGKAKA